MADDISARLPEPGTGPGDDGIFDWLRWWHWLILAALFLGGLFYFPLWRFEQKWKQIQVGDPLDRVQQVLGDVHQGYSVTGAVPGGPVVSYTYSRYWRTYEVQVDESTQCVVALNDYQLPSTAAGPTPPFIRKR